MEASAGAWRLPDSLSVNVGSGETLPPGNSWNTSWHWETWDWLLVNHVKKSTNYSRLLDPSWSFPRQHLQSAHFFNRMVLPAWPYGEGGLVKSLGVATPNVGGRGFGIQNRISSMYHDTSASTRGSLHADECSTVSTTLVARASVLLMCGVPLFFWAATVSLNGSKWAPVVASCVDISRQLSPCWNWHLVRAASRAFYFCCKPCRCSLVAPPV